MFLSPPAPGTSAGLPRGVNNKSSFFFPPKHLQSQYDGGNRVCFCRRFQLSAGRRGPSGEADGGRNLTRTNFEHKPVPHPYLFFFFFAYF